MHGHIYMYMFAFTNANKSSFKYDLTVSLLRCDLLTFILFYFYLDACKISLISLI